MDENYVVITLFGYYDFYLPADQLRNLAFINNKLVNIGTNNITMINYFSDSTSYPYVSCQSMRACRIYTSNQSYSIVNERYTLKSPYYNINTLGSNGFNTLFLLLLSILVGLKLLWKN